MADPNDLVAQLMDITGCDPAVGMSLLEATNFDLDQAVGLHFASMDAGGPDAGSVPARAGAAAGASDPFAEDEVRAPIPAKVDRLYDMDNSAAGMGSTSGWRQEGVRGFLGAGPSRPQPPLQSLGDFRAAGMPGIPRPGAPTPPDSSVPSDMQSLFPAPTAILYKGNPDAAAQLAKTEKKWILVNVQDTDFNSLRMNRDTFGDDLLKDTIRGMFIFLQFPSTSPHGQQLLQQYHLNGLPQTMVIDPMTGACLHSRTGFINAERLLEDLVPFMDHGPEDPQAVGIANTLSRRKAQTASTAAAAAAAAGGRAGSQPPSAAPPPAEALTEDEQLAMAIAMSMQQDGDEGAGSGSPSSSRPVDNDNDDDDDDDQALEQELQRLEAERNKPKPEEIQAAATGRLPPEPAAGSEGSCRVAVRWPDGSRMQRCFLKEHTLQAVNDWVVSVNLEAAQRPFQLSLAGPGAQPVANMEISLADSHIANAMLNMRWAD